MTATLTAPAEVLGEFFRRFGSGDRPALLELFAETTHFDVPGAATVPWTGARSTRPELDEFFELTTSLVATERFEVDQIVTQDDTAVAFGNFRHVVLATGKAFDSSFALQIRVDAQGHIDTYRMFEDSAGAAAAFAA